MRNKPKTKIKKTDLLDIIASIESQLSAIKTNIPECADIDSKITECSLSEISYRLCDAEKSIVSACEIIKTL